MNLRYENLFVSLKILQAWIVTMKGTLCVDVKLNLQPLVVLEKIEELGENAREKSVFHLKNNSKINDLKKMKFLLKLGLVSNRELGKSQYSTFNEPSLKKIRSGLCRRKRATKFCCAGLATNSQGRWHRGDDFNWDRVVDKYSGDQILSLIQIKMNPRVCVRKWLGGDRIVKSCKKFCLLENALIPKTGNHSSCIERPKKCRALNECDVDTPRQKRRSLLEKKNDDKMSESVLIPEIGNKNSSSDVKSLSDCKRLLRSHLRMSNGLVKSQLVMQNPTKGMAVKNCLVKEHGVNNNIKELKVCLKRWEGDKSILVSKEQKNLDNLLTVPTGSSHTACKKAKLMEVGSCMSNAQSNLNT